MSILTILTLHVPPDRSDEVLTYYESARVLEESGAQSTQLCVKPDDSGTVVVVAQWPDISAYEVWQSSEARSEFLGGFRALLVTR